MTRQSLRTPSLLIACLVLLCAGSAAAQSVYWQPTELGAGQRGVLDLVFEDSEPVGPVELPEIAGLRVLGPPSQSTSLSVINGMRTSSVTLSFPVRADQVGTLRIPAFEVETGDGMAAVAALELNVGPATVRDQGGASTRLEDAVHAQLTASKAAPYAGEVIDLDLVVAMRGNRRGQVVGAPAWHSDAAVAEPWSEGRSVATGRGGAVRTHTRAIVPQAGSVELPPAELEVEIETTRRNPLDPFAGLGRGSGRGLLESFFSGGEMTPGTVQSNSVPLDVRALPAPSPEGFAGAVGQFALESKLTPEQPKTGEPVTWTLTLVGTGNWPAGVALPARAVPADLRTLQPKQRSTFGESDRFSGEVSEDLVLVPNKPGDLTLAPVRFVYFNPESERYETAEVTPPVLHVAGAPIGDPAAAPAQAAAPAAAADTTSQAPANAIAAPALAAPVIGSATGHAPWRSETVIALSAVPLAVAALYWLAVFAWRAIAHHPRRMSYRLRRELRRAVELARTAGEEGARTAAVLRWQHAAARWLRLDLAAPTSAQLAAISDARWAEAWAGSEQGLYRRGHALPDGWYDLALALCAKPARQRRAPRLRRPLRPLIAKAATAAAALLCLAGPARAEDPADPVPAKDREVAAPQPAPAVDPRLALRARVVANPLDWIARYNLGVAEASAGAPGRAMGETLAAFLQAPRTDVVRDNLASLIAQAPSADPTLVPLASRRTIAAVASPWTWQITAIASAVLAGFGLLVIPRRRLAIAALAVGAAGAVTSAVALHQYGPLTDPQAALIASAAPLRAVPTDAQPAEGAPALPIGAVVTVDRHFLGWTRVQSREGINGWLRHADVVELYRAADA